MEKIRKKYINYAFIFSMAFMPMSFSLKVETPVKAGIVIEVNNNEMIEACNDVDSKFNQQLDNTFFEELNKNIEYKRALHQAYKIMPQNFTEFNLENEYSGMALLHEYEDEIKKIASKYNIPYKVMLIIGDQESNGKWDNNGKISSTNDYGVFQINKRNHAYVKEQLGYTPDELLNDPIKNADAAAYLIREVMNHKSVKELNDIFGMYNAWTGWETNEQALKYVSQCNERLEKYFPDFEYNHNETINEPIEVKRYDENYMINLILEKMGFPEKAQRLNELMNFKVNILKSNYEHIGIICDYKEMETKLIALIESDSITSQETWIKFYNCYLIEINDLLLQNRYDEAMIRYSKMLYDLGDYYDFENCQSIYKQQLVKTKIFTLY